MFPTAQALHDRTQTYLYGRRGTPTSRAVEEAVAMVEGGHNAKMAPSGMAAITTALLAFLNAGDHLLMVDTVYQPGPPALRRAAEAAWASRPPITTR